MKMNLIHYGAKTYHRKKFKPISDLPFRIKPLGGLWTSLVDSKYSWYDWGTDESFGDMSKSFEIEFEGSVLVIDSLKDMLKLPWIETGHKHFVSFQCLCNPVFFYDAIHLTVKGQEETRFTHPKSLYGWDCETVFVMNPASLKQSLQEDINDPNTWEELPFG